MENTRIQHIQFLKKIFMSGYESHYINKLKSGLNKLDFVTMVVDRIESPKSLK